MIPNISIEDQDAMLDAQAEFFRREGDFRNRMFAQFEQDVKTAITKTDPALLTEEEKFALAYYAGLPVIPNNAISDGYTHEFKLTTIPCAFRHDGEKWIVASMAKDWPKTI